MYTIFLARFVGEGEDFRGFTPNFSTTKKVSAMQSCLRNAGVRPILIVTHAGDISSPRTAVVRKIGDSICVIPASTSLVRNRLFRYLHGIIHSALLVYKLRKRLRISLFFSWDYLPDTLLPILLQGRKALSSTIVDVEESISADPRAGRLFKIFERLVVRHVPLRAIGNNVTTELTLDVKFEAIFKGFFANSIEEEHHLIRRTKRKRFDKETVVLFSGRIDNVRGSDEFTQLARSLQYTDGIQFVMTGYGNPDELASITNGIPRNLTFRPSLNREAYIDLLFRTDIAFNFLSDEKFAMNSFPSKIVEYLLGSVVVVSNHRVDIDSDRIFVYEDLNGIRNFIVDYHKERETWRKSYRPEVVHQELSPFKISSCSSVFRSLVNA